MAQQKNMKDVSW